MCNDLNCNNRFTLETVSGFLKSQLRDGFNTGKMRTMKKLVDKLLEDEQEIIDKFELENEQ
jgi:hypothetical protein